MRNRKLRTIARRWWGAGGGTRDWDRVYDLVRFRHDLVPSLIRELVRTGPQAGDRYVGTAIVEELADAPDFDGRPQRAAELLLAARLTNEELFGVLSGVTVNHLERMRARERLSSRLSTEQLDWLLDPTAKHRWANDGTMVADGDSIRFKAGPTEWMELYWLPDHSEDREEAQRARQLAAIDELAKIPVHLEE